MFPWFLFTGVLIKRIYAHTDRVAARHPEIEFVKAPYLNDHPAVLDAFAERVEETLRGANLMNCKLCKYRERILGFEAEKGLPQESHHHHVEGIGAGPRGESRDGQARDQHHDHAPSHSHPRDDHDHDHPHGHDHHHGAAGSASGHTHAHGHTHGHHHPYPHADHPLGPKSLRRGKG